MSGYSSEAVDAFSLGKCSNVVLFDQSDMDKVFDADEPVRFETLLRSRIRFAAETGRIYQSTRYDKMSVVGKNRQMEIVSKAITSERRNDRADLIVVCEGDSDRIVLEMLIDRLLVLFGLEAALRIKIVAAGGKLELARVADLFKINHDKEKVHLVIDGDGDTEQSRDLVFSRIQRKDCTFSVTPQGIESWFALSPMRHRRQQLVGKIGTYPEYDSAIKSLELDSVREKAAACESFAELVRAVVGKTGEEIRATGEGGRPESVFRCVSAIR